LPGFERPSAAGTYDGVSDRKGGDVYIGGGVLALILIILLLVWLF
jgi:hypothetical protein